jgi:hypothetical protein
MQPRELQFVEYLPVHWKKYSAREIHHGMPINVVEHNRLYINLSLAAVSCARRLIQVNGAMLYATLHSGPAAMH